MIRLRIRESTRVFRCDVAGCSNRTRFLITKRDDAATHPLHLCAACIRGLSEILDGMERPADAPETAQADGTETVIVTVNVGDRTAAEGEKAPAQEETPAPEEVPAAAPKRSRRKATAGGD